MLAAIGAAAPSSSPPPPRHFCLPRRELAGAGATARPSKARPPHRPRRRRPFRELGGRRTPGRGCRWLRGVGGEDRVERRRREGHCVYRRVPEHGAQVGRSVLHLKAGKQTRARGGGDGSKFSIQKVKIGSGERRLNRKKTHHAPLTAISSMRPLSPRPNGLGRRRRCSWPLPWREPEASSNRKAVQKVLNSTRPRRSSVLMVHGSNVQAPRQLWWVWVPQ